LQLLGIDLGTSAVKALVVGLDGTVRGRGSAPYPTDQPTPDRAEQDPHAWWQATTIAVRQAIAEASSAEIAAIGLSGQMHGTVFLGENAATGPAIIWSDRRSAAEVDELTTRIGHDRLVQITGSALATGFQAATIRWVKQHQPEGWAVVRTVLLPKDYLGWRLTGDLITEPSDAASTLLLDIHRRDWSDDILSALDLSRAHLPQIVASTTIRGALQDTTAAELGLQRDIPVVAGGADAPLAALAAGVVDPTTMLLTLSSGSQVLVPATTPTVDPLGRVHTWCSCLDRGARWYQMGATLASGLAVQWLRENVFSLDGPNAHHELDRRASATPPGAAGLLFLPYLAGERTPHLDPHARGVFLGLSTNHHRGHLTRAVMEGATLALFDAARVLPSSGAAPEKIVLAGGGARSAVWRQIVADVFGVPVVPLATVDGSALGAALVAGAGIGSFDLAETAQTWTRYDDPTVPNPAAHQTYQRLLPIFREAYTKHRDDFRELAAIASASA
jgi:xylulokinase